MVQTRAQARRFGNLDINEAAWRAFNAGQGLDNREPVYQDNRPAPVANRDEAYAPNDASHRHRLPDNSPYDVDVVVHKRRHPM